MSNPDRPSASQQIAATTEVIVDRFTGGNQDFDTIEKTAHLKDGLEIPLMIVASIPDNLQTIYNRRLEDKTIAMRTLDDNPDNVILEFYEAPALNKNKRLRYEQAINMMRSLDKHFLQLSTSSREGKRSDQIIDLGKAMQSHNAEETRESKLDKMQGWIDRRLGR